MKPIAFLKILFVLSLIWLVYSIRENSETTQNDISIQLDDPQSDSIKLRVAVVGDVHLSEDVAEFQRFYDLINQIKSVNPDMIFFVGDYISSPSRLIDINHHRKRIVEAISKANVIPTTVVLGNYETMSNPQTWLEEFKAQNVTVLENEIAIQLTKVGQVCVRGLGDAHTYRSEFIEFPDQCQNAPKITITHDPAAVFEMGLTGFVIAGHTHCGQISLPIIGPVWVPSKAPREAHCGLYKDFYRTLFVTSGIGTTNIPVRIGTKSQWDMITLRL